MKHDDTYKCPQCSKDFICYPAEWVYKLTIQKKSPERRTKYYCSYSCYMKGKYPDKKK